MDKRQVLSMVDHTLLGVTSTYREIETLCDEAVAFGTASVCIAPCYVKRAYDYLHSNARICTVIGFPNGYMTPSAKLFETEEALESGADEIDMVINVGKLKCGELNDVEDEIRSLKKVCGSKILKVIVEACYLTQKEKIDCCHIITNAGADFIKTSTGFGKGGATLEDVLLFKENIGASVKIKAAGGIRTFESAIEFINAGCSRIGSSNLVKIAAAEELAAK